MVVGATVMAAVLFVGYQALQGQNAPGQANPQRVIIKICNWDGVVPEKALDGFPMPAGKWADYQRDGWQVESYLVAPNGDQGNPKQGLYAVLRQGPGRLRPGRP